jgi:methionyl-tRNA synthetase
MAQQQKRKRKKLTPREICNKYFLQHEAIYKWFDISFDHFGRTSCEDPWNTPDWPQTKIAQEIFLDNKAQGNLVEEVVEQMFCLGCTKFLADRFIVGVCPFCQFPDARGDQCDSCGKLLNSNDLIQPKCKLNGEHTVEVRKSSHLFLDLPKLEEALRAWIKKSSEEGKWTSNAVQITQNWLNSGLKPRCITRDLKWGTPVPVEEFKDKVFYVWFDAPIGYISITATYTPEWRKWWINPAENNVKLYQFMGKDNVPFHTVIFPSSLIGTGKDWTLLHHVSTTEYLNYESGKFSKSRGVGVFGDAAATTGIPSEVWRYYLLTNRPESSDSVFSWTEFGDRNNNELLKNIGNLVQRALSFVYSSFEGKVPAPVAPFGEREESLIAAVNKLLTEYNEAMTAVKIKVGLKLVMDISFEGNKYMQDSKPWEMIKTDPAKCSTAIVLIASLIRLLANIAEPFMPGFTDKVLFALDLPHSDIPDTFSINIPEGHKIQGKPTPIFQTISQDQLQALREKYAGKQEEQAASTTAPAAAPAASAGKGATKKAPATKEQSPDLPAIAKVDLRVGLIKRVWPHPTAEKLWCEEIDLGEPTGPRTIASGLRAFYTAEEMTNRKVIVVANLKPRVMMGFESQGMVLCASNEVHDKVEFITVPDSTPVGERVVVEGLSTSQEFAEVINTNKKGNAWMEIAPELKTSAEKVAMFKDVPLSTSGGVLTSPSLASATIS